MSVTQAYGANIAFIEELYERYRANPESVSASWREFFQNEVAELQGAKVAEEETQQPSTRSTAAQTHPRSAARPRRHPPPRRGGQDRREHGGVARRAHRHLHPQ